MAKPDPLPCEAIGCEAERTRRVLLPNGTPRYLCDSHAAEVTEYYGAEGHDTQNVAIDPDVQEKEREERKSKKEAPPPPQ